MSAVRPTYRAVFIISAAVMLISIAAHPEDVRHHGLYLDEQNRVHLKQVRGDITIGLMKRARPEYDQLPAGAAQDGDVSRMTNIEELAHVTSEVIEAAAPNYLRNPGRRYRLTIQGLSIEPQYKKIIEVTAGEARDVLFTEIMNLAARTDGARRDALYYGGILCLSALGEAQVFPGYDVPIALQRKNVFEVRVGEGITLERQALQDALPAETERERAARTASAYPSRQAAMMGSAGR